MSEVKDVRDSTGDVSDHAAADVGAEAEAEDLSGYLCGACEEPLPYGASACVACGTPVAPLEDDEMVAGPYVIDESGAGADAPADAAPDAPGGPDPYAPPAPAAWAPPDAGGDVLDLSKPDDGLPPPPPTYTGLYEAPAGPGPSGNGHDHGGSPAVADAPADPPGSGAPEPVGVPGYPGHDDPADVIGVERPTYPMPTVGDPGPDPMLGWGPTAPVMAPPGEEAPLIQGLQAAERRAGGQQGDSRGSGLTIVVGAVVALLAVLAVAAVFIARGSETPESAAPSTTAAPAPAPPPMVRNNTVVPTTTLPDEPPSLDKFCAAGYQFRLDPDPDSVAHKFLSNPGLLMAAVEALAYNVPEDGKATVVPMRDAMQSLATKVSSGELRTVADIRNAVGPNGTPLWPRFDQIVNPLYTRHCAR